MWMLHQILHVMFESNKSKFRWCIHVATEVHGEILKITASLNSDVHEYTNPIIDLSSMLFINAFQLFSNEICSHEECLFKRFIHWKGWFLEFCFVLCNFSPILLNDIFHYVICRVNTDPIFTIFHVNVGELQFCFFLESIFRKSVKIFYQSFKINFILCLQEDKICFNSKKVLIMLDS